MAAEADDDENDDDDFEKREKMLEELWRADFRRAAITSFISSQLNHQSIRIFTFVNSSTAAAKTSLVQVLQR
jgi:hypothetical protein